LGLAWWPFEKFLNNDGGLPPIFSPRLANTTWETAKIRQELARLRGVVTAAREEIAAAKVASDAGRKVARLGRGIETAFSEFHQLVLEPSV